MGVLYLTALDTFIFFFFFTPWILPISFLSLLTFSICTMKWRGQLLFTHVWCKGIFVSAPSELLHWPQLTALNILKFASSLHTCLVVSGLWDDPGFSRAAPLGYQGKELSSSQWGHCPCLSCYYPPLFSFPPAVKQSWLHPGSDSLPKVQLPLPFWISCMPVPLDALEFWKEGWSNNFPSQEIFNPIFTGFYRINFNLYLSFPI